MSAFTQGHMHDCDVAPLAAQLRKQAAGRDLDIKSVGSKSHHARKLHKLSH